MNLDKYETSFFTKQIVDTVTALGFEQPDIDFTNTSLCTVFGDRCSPATTVISPEADEQLQSICVAANCPLDVNATCGAYPNGGLVEQPVIANASLLDDVVKENETAAAPMAAWPVHCKRDGSSGEQECAFSSSTASATPGGSSGNGASPAAGRWDVGFLVSVVFNVVMATIGAMFMAW